MRTFALLLVLLLAMTGCSASINAEVSLPFDAESLKAKFEEAGFKATNLIEQYADKPKLKDHYKYTKGDSIVYYTNLSEEADAKRFVKELKEKTESEHDGDFKSTVLGSFEQHTLEADKSVFSYTRVGTKVLNFQCAKVNKSELTDLIASLLKK